VSSSLVRATDADRVIDALDRTVARARGSRLYRDRLAGIRVRELADVARIPLTTRADLEAAGIDGTRAASIEAVCHYGETSGTTGTKNSTWLTSDDFARDAAALRMRHPDVFAPGRILLNRFPFMAAPAHIVQLVAQQGGGVAIPAGNINWDVPFPRALELLRDVGAHVVAGLPIEPVVLGEIARAAGVDPAATTVDTLFLGGAPLPPSMQRRLARVWGARVIELYGSTETMLLGTSCNEGTLHLATDLAYCEMLDVDDDAPATGDVGRLVVTTLAIDGSPLVRFETGDVVRITAPCACGNGEPGVVVLGRQADVLRTGGETLYAFDVVDAAAAAADAVDSSVFFIVALPERLLVRIETASGANVTAAERALAGRLPGTSVEVELVEPCMLLDVELLGRSPHVYKPAVLSDWTRARRRILTVGEGMIEWPRPTWDEGWRWLRRAVATERRRRRLGRGARLAG